MTDHEKNPECVARGLKAAIHNPHVSTGAKDHAAQQLKEMDDAQKAKEEVDHVRRQFGKKAVNWSGRPQGSNFHKAGYKAAVSSRWNIFVSSISFFSYPLYHITDERTSPETKKKLQTILDSVANGGVKNEKRVMGGYKAALKSKSRNITETEQHMAELYICRPFYIGRS